MTTKEKAAQVAGKQSFIERDGRKVQVGYYSLTAADQGKFKSLCGKPGGAE